MYHVYDSISTGGSFPTYFISLSEGYPRLVQNMSFLSNVFPYHIIFYSKTLIMYEDLNDVTKEYRKHERFNTASILSTKKN
jgi:hypothetical protein